MTLLSTIKRAATLAGDVPPGVAIGNPDAKIALMVELARMEAEELSRRIDWSSLQRSSVFTTVAGVNQANALPADYGRMPSRPEMRGTNQVWSVMGPLDSASWDRLVDFPSGSVLSNWRIFGDVLQLLPSPSAGLTVRFNYITRNLYYAADGTTSKPEWELDTDTCFIPENLIALGVVWRWRKREGLDYAEDMRTAELEVERMAGQDGGGRHAITFGRSRMLRGVFAYPGILGH